jgi:hypothetical protein
VPDGEQGFPYRDPYHGRKPGPDQGFWLGILFALAMVAVILAVTAGIIYAVWQLA